MTTPVSSPLPWPVLTRYENEHLLRVALPIGGIGTGTVSVGGRGDLRDFEIVNRPAKGWTPPHCFFALWAKRSGETAVTRLLEGPLPPEAFEGATGSRARNHGLPRFRHARFEAAYPLGQVHLSDPDVPLTARLEAFNPLVVGDVEQSGLPIAVFRWVLTNPDPNESVEASVCASLQNFVGDDGVQFLAKCNCNEARDTADLSGLLFRAGDISNDAPTWGSVALAVLASNKETTRRTAWPSLSWGNSLLDFWDDFSADGKLEERIASESENRPVGSVATRVTIEPGQSVAIPFVMGWHFPNRWTWTPNDGNAVWLADGQNEVGPPVIGNYYTTHFADAWETVTYAAANLSELEAQTVQFVRAFCEQDLPNEVKEAALYNVSTLRTQTVFRTPDGRFYGWEGINDHYGSCFGSCTHVWNYEQTTAFLFGLLARSLRETEFLQMTEPDTGLMRFRVALPLAETNLDGPAPGWRLAAADGQMGCLMKLYRDWQLSGDATFLRRLWPQAKKTLEFCWIPGGWDADRDGVMEGCQHNTMDVEYYGPNPQMGTWYLGALRAMEEMARYLGEADFAHECHRLFESGSRYMDETLFNGDYYEHHIVPPANPLEIAPGLRHPNMGATDVSDPDLQLGAGCLVDQLVGQYMAHVCGLGYLLKPENVRRTLDSIVRFNFKTDLRSHFNHLRSFALADEPALLMATYPRGRRPVRPFPYYNEVMTGFEHTAAAHLLYEGLTESGLNVVRAIRARYDGRRRSPFDEAECGHHYARAMAAWAHVLALTGFHRNAADQRICFAAPPNDKAVTWVWSDGQAWGTVKLEPTSDSTISVCLSVLHGRLDVRELCLDGCEPVTWPASVAVTRGNPLCTFVPSHSVRQTKTK